ncbi:MAG: ketoacyl-ACP synthase III [Ignavibacteria bacterium]|nr:ketoacyl-ACP synthase III [Ignavibacteria bacterium]
MSKTSPVNAMITAVGHYVPDRVVDNKYFESFLDTNDLWIQTRTGIKERRYLDKDKPTSTMAIPAVQMLLKNRGISAEELDVIIVSTVTPDMPYPSTACIIQEAICAKNCWGFDLSAACSGFLFAINTGAKLIESGSYKKVLVVGADKMTSISNYKDRNTCILFGDGAAAVLLEPTEDKEYGIIDSILHIDGSGGEFLYQPGGGSLHPASHETVDKDMHFVHQDGKAVFKVAVVGMADVSEEIVLKNNLKGEDISYLVPHQANMRIITAAGERMGLPPEKVMVNIHKYGNTTCATIPLCISEYWHEGKIKKGDYIVLASFGAGYTWGSVLVRWAY